MPGLPIARPVVFPLAHVGVPEGVSPPLPEAVPDPKEKKRACDKAWREANPEKVAARKQKWRDKNPERNAAQKRAWRAANAGSVRLRNTGWTAEAFEAAWAAQGGCCSICRVAMKKSGRGGQSVTSDHCHAQDKPRGLLCHRCNTGLGQFQDQPERLRAAAIYLEVHS